MPRVYETFKTLYLYSSKHTMEAKLKKFNLKKEDSHEESLYTSEESSDLETNSQST